MSEIRFGNYRVVEALGSGALATIYKAVQEPLGRVVALKALKTQIAPSSSFGEQLDREAKILRDLAHPNVVLLLDVGRTAAGRPFLVLENIEGPSLQQLLEKKRMLPLEAALAIAVGVCAALEHVHERNVVHRDVKPGNVLVTSGGVVKLIDFGIAQRAHTASLSDAFGSEGVTPSGRLAPEAVKDAFGTPAYMSPSRSSVTSWTAGVISSRWGSCSTRCSAGAGLSRRRRPNHGPHVPPAAWTGALRNASVVMRRRRSASARRTCRAPWSAW